MNIIEFKGEMSQKGRRLLNRIQTFPWFFICPLVIAALSMPMMGIMIFGRFPSKEQLPEMAIAFGAGALLLFIFYLIVRNKMELPSRIEIIPDKTIKSQCKKKTYICSIHNVRKVVDYGDFYSIRINQQLEYGPFLCQKDLLSKGSIEEFEKIFENKIVRKLKG